MTEALEIEIERAWCALDSIPRRRRTLYLTTGCFRLHWESYPPAGTVEVGTYSLSVSLEHLREDVFHEFEKLQGRAHGR